MPQETILCLTQDQKGFYWLGTSDGIVRFDGHDFYIPQPDTNSGLDIAGYRIGAILAKDKNIYIGTGQNGLVVYNINEESTTQLLDPDSNCTRIIKHDSIILAAFYNKGVAVITSGKSKFIPFNIENPKEITGLSILNNTVYLSTKNGDIYSFSSNNILENETIKLNKIAKTNDPITNIEILDQRLFVYTTNGILTLNSTNNTVKKIPSSDSSISLDLNINTIKKINNIYYIGSNNGLITAYLVDEKFQIINQYKANKKDNLNTVSFDNIYALHADNKGNLIIGSFNLEMTSTTKDEVFKNPTNLFNVNDPSVFAVIDTKNYLFTATSSGLVISDNKDLSKFKTFPSYRARGFVKDHLNNLWIATGKGAFIINLDTINLENPNFIELPSKTGNASHLPSNNIRSIYKDSANTIWVTSYSDGFSKFIGNVKNNSFEFINYNTDQFPSRLTISMIEDSYGMYWMTTQKGLSSFNFNSGNLNLLKNYDESNGLATRGVLSAFEDSSKTLWIATRKGLSKYNRKRDEFTSFGKRDGLSNTFIYNINEDDLGNLWLSTNGGLFRFNKSTKEFTNYNPKDGVQSTEFNLGAVYKNKNNGFLYFGGINGVNIFDPKQIYKLDKEGQLNFTQLKIKDKTVSPNESSVISSSIINAKHIELNHNDFPINLSFSGLDFRPNSNIKYVYKLLPDDTDWNALDYKNYIQFISLAPKKYTLQIQGKSRNDLWQKQPLQLTINVNPPWYKSNLAYLTYLLFFLGIVYAFYKLSLQRQIAGQESIRLQELDSLKSRFITNITHEFRTPLTIILGYLDNLKEQFLEKDDVTTSLNTIEQNSNSLLNLVNQMLDLAKLEKGQLNINLIQNDIVAFSSHITNSFLSIAKDKQIKLNFNSNPEKIIMDFDAEKMRQILTNLISNALKFSPEDSELKIHINKLKNSTLQILIMDEGYGIPEEELPLIFDRFFQVENNEHKISQGTGIGLALTKELVELFKGSISVKSTLGTGTTFTITLPITNNVEEKSIELNNKQLSIGTVVPQLNDIIVNDDSNTVLIIEDNVDMARYIASCLQPDYKVSFAKNGKEGLKLAETTIPDVVVTDVMMPIMDGFELTQKLQANTKTNHIPIIMLTSKAMQEDKLEGITSGVDAYLTKPFQKEELRLRMKMLITKRKQLQKTYSIPTILEQKEEQPKPIDKNIIFLNKAIESVHKHLDNSNFGAAELAKFMLMSDSQLYRKLKAISNTSTAIFIRKVRLEKAKELLKTSNLTVSEIAYASGFNDPNWFSKAFKEEFHKSPTSFRN
ncbi:ATP-binding protein [Oceanihabitans sp. 2_MG-2023]|uniref:hybrid sensor histidine kinase/response regulator transcription factor n=1 Tax=Oceanihabitans sp. 2_MG-2023 TaxID=3062661 RepID=UPI0026E36E73|nr:hybrid sensor histidine kinase/response regulator transcription factor [Oceanihabitans sp. 2_MG-2023]MDO6596397.1 ATP-binding protein [Oceanihabitans sp. 2_MG-2023]